MTPSEELWVALQGKPTATSWLLCRQTLHTRSLTHVAAFQRVALPPRLEFHLDYTTDKTCRVPFQICKAGHGQKQEPQRNVMPTALWGPGTVFYCQKEIITWPWELYCMQGSDLSVSRYLSGHLFLEKQALLFIALCVWEQIDTSCQFSKSSFIAGQLFIWMPRRERETFVRLKRLALNFHSSSVSPLPYPPNPVVAPLNYGCSSLTDLQKILHYFSAPKLKGLTVLFLDQIYSTLSPSPVPSGFIGPVILYL